MFALLNESEQLLVRQKVWLGSEQDGEFVCDFGCGFSSNSFNTVGTHEVWCLKNENRKLRNPNTQGYSQSRR